MILALRTGRGHEPRNAGRFFQMLEKARKKILP